MELFEENVNEVIGKDGRRFVLRRNPMRQVVETDLTPRQADPQTIHDLYKDLVRVERDFRTLKSGHLEFRPWFVCTQDNTQAHALTSMLALKVRRHLERAWWSLNALTAYTLNCPTMPLSWAATLANSWALALVCVAPDATWREDSLTP